MVEKSLHTYGAGRSILVDRNGQIIAGNKTTEAAAAIGLEGVKVVQTDGRELVVVQRTDLDLDEDAAARELAIVDNRAGELGLEWDAEVLAELGAEVDLEPFFRRDELARLMGEDIPDPSELWQGMPEFEQGDKTAFKSILVHFENIDDMYQFARLVNHTLTEKTKSIWFPRKEKENLANVRYDDES